MAATAGKSATPRGKQYPDAALPDTAVGGAVEGVAVSGGTARLLDAESGQVVERVAHNLVDLVRHTDGRFYYRFDGVPDGSYHVEIHLLDGRRMTSGLAMPGVEAGDVYAD
jgi:hypothetical protein